MIEVAGLTKRFGSLAAVDDLSFTVRPGLVTGFLGPNGAGKTTTMKVILGLESPSSGGTRVNGRRYVDIPAPLREVGALLDARAMHPGRRAQDHLASLAASNAIPESRVGEVLRVVGLDTVPRRRCGEFSLGMSQRLGIAAALLGDPPVLMFDEPVNGLDPEGIVWVREMMRALAREGRTVLVSSHLMSEMALTADHLVVIGRGRLIADTGVNEFVESSAEQTVRVRSPQGEEFAAVLRGRGATVQPAPEGELVVAGMDAADIGELAASRGFVLHQLATQRPSLEEAFMEITKDSVEYHAGEGSTP
jgi:ABC-2 type transport system ATP-binding protein